RPSRDRSEELSALSGSNGCAGVARLLDYSTARLLPLADRREGQPCRRGGPQPAPPSFDRASPGSPEMRIDPTGT
ncbi:MAG: hypothetical protein ABEL76_09410, partial [Bradymonadaceae bacterium]